MNNGKGGGKKVNFYMIKNSIICICFLITLSCRTGGIYKQLPGGYVLVETSSNQISISKPDFGSGDIYIPSDVCRIFFNAEYIIAEQKKLPYQENAYKKTEGSFAYWILDVKNNELFGPLTYNELEKYIKESTSLNSIDFISVDEYRKKWL